MISRFPLGNVAHEQKSPLALQTKGVGVQCKGIGRFERYFQHDDSHKNSGPLDLKAIIFESPKINGDNKVSFRYIFNSVVKSARNRFKFGRNIIHRINGCENKMQN